MAYEIENKKNEVNKCMSKIKGLENDILSLSDKKEKVKIHTCLVY